MAVRGAAEKARVSEKILETFAGSFALDKEIRIPIRSEETNEIIQIKVTLTAAKDNVPSPTDEVTVLEEGVTVPPVINKPAEPKIAEPSPEEMAKVDDFLRKMGIV